MVDLKTLKTVEQGDILTIKVVARNKQLHSSPVVSDILYFGRPGGYLLIQDIAEVVEIKKPEKPWAAGDLYYTRTWETDYYRVVFIDDKTVITERVSSGERYMFGADLPSPRSAFPGDRCRVT